MPLFWTALAFLGGIWLASIVPLPAWLWLIVGILCLIIGIILKLIRRQWMLVLLLLPAFFFLGAARYQGQQPIITPDHIAYYNDNPQKIYVTGTLVEPPDVRDTYI